MVVEPMSMATPKARSREARPDRDDLAPVAHRGGGLPVARAQRLLQAGEHGEVRAAPRRRPIARASASCRRRKSLDGSCMSGSRDLDVVQPHDRIDLDRMRLGALAHDLPVDLALGRHVDDEVAADPRLAAEAAARRSGAALVGVALLDRVPRA